MPSRFTQFLESRVIKSLTEEANNIAEKARQNASWSKRIPNAISVSEARKTGSGFEVIIEIDSTPDGPAPHAAAFEYGSGEHGDTGAPYIISPKEKAALAFEWPGHDPPWGSQKFIGLGEDGKFLFRFVEHPGVKARPYLRPAIESEQGRLVSKLGRAFRDAFRDSVVRVEVISAKK